MRTNNIIILTLMVAFSIAGTGCSKMIEIDPPLGETSSITVFRSDATSRSALSGLYSGLSSSQTQSNLLTLYTSLAADDLRFLGTVASYDDYIFNNLDPVLTTSLNSVFNELYASINRANSIITGLETTTGTSAAVRKQIIAEAKFLRAYCFFHLVNLFGDVPLVNSTNTAVTAFLPRTPVAEVYTAIISDLTYAKDSLRTDYSASANDRSNANRFAAAALLARVHLYTGNMAEAENNATEVISNTALYELIPATSMRRGVFVKNNREAIFHFLPYIASTNGYTNEGANFIPATYSATTINWSLREELWNTFDDLDLRKRNWIQDTTLSGVRFHIPFKYKNATQALAAASGVVECPIVLRLSEQFLIRAEARMRKSAPDATGALSDLNMVHTRAGLDALTITDPTALLNEIYSEKRKEFFCELGHRWYDLKRTNRANVVLGALKSTWTATDALFPIPQTARDANPNLSQNPGYNQ